VVWMLEGEEERWAYDTVGHTRQRMHDEIERAGEQRMRTKMSLTRHLMCMNG
jgi:hypothetical protein